MENNLLSPAKDKRFAEDIENFKVGKDAWNAPSEVVELANEGDFYRGLIEKQKQREPLSTQVSKALNNFLAQNRNELESEYGLSKAQADDAVIKLQSDKNYVENAVDNTTYKQALSKTYHINEARAQAAVGTPALMVLPGAVGGALRTTITLDGSAQAGYATGQVVNGDFVNGIPNVVLGGINTGISLGAGALPKSTKGFGKTVSEQTSASTNAIVLAEKSETVQGIKNTSDVLKESVKREKLSGPAKNWSHYVNNEKSIIENVGKDTHEFSNLYFADTKKWTDHFVKHGGEFNSKNMNEYLNMGRDIAKNGYKVEYDYKGETKVGYVEFIGNKSSSKPGPNKGASKFGFVAINKDGNIATIHVKSGKEFWKTLNGDVKDKTIRPKND